MARRGAGGSSSMIIMTVLIILVMWFALGCIIASPIGRFIKSADVTAK